jgi:hypothetical protein
MGSKHVTGPCLVFDQGLSIFYPGTPGPCCEWSGPLVEGSGPHPKGPACTRGGPRPPLGVLAAKPRGPAHSHGGPDLLLIS